MTLWGPHNRSGDPADVPKLSPNTGLNVHSLLKHQTLVLTLDAVAFLEQRLLWHDRRYSPLYPFSMPYRDLPEPPRAG